jgi:uncharacterized protein (DUF2384 family)
MSEMRKTKTKKYKVAEEEISMVNEEEVLYETSKTKKQASVINITADFTFATFKAIADTVNFTLADWAELLYMSERTLLRYAKDNANFNGLQIERILVIQQLLILGNQVFGTNLASWLKTPSIRFNGKAPFSQMFSHAGVLSVTNYIGQIQHGNVA